MRRIVFCVIALSLAACSTIGTGPSKPDGLPHGGVGPFRLLSPDELDLPATPAGLTLRDVGRSVESGMVAGRHMFYAGARLLPAPDGGMPDGGVDDGGIDDGGIDDGGVDDAGIDGADAAIEAEDAGVDPEARIPRPDWSLHEPRRILRSAPRENGQLGYDAGSDIFTADAAWEGGFVHDPWAVVLPDGRARLYYAAAGGIGVAEASAIDGTFTRVGDGQTIVLPGARRPTVVSTEGLETTHAFLLYLEIDGTIRGYGSPDGLAFTEIATLAIEPLPARDERDSVEVSIGSPGAVVVRTEAGRSVLRIYYESRREDGQNLLAMAGSFDAITFANHVDEVRAVPVFAGREASMPAPLQIDSRVTFLYMISPNRGRGAVVAGIAPGGVMLP